MPSRSEFAVRFATLSALLLTLAGLLAALLFKLIPPFPDQSPTHFSPVFLASTAFLVIGSLSLSRACRFVRREKQRLFRKHLLIALAAGTLFVSSQTHALTRLAGQQLPDEAQTGAGAFVAVIATLHAAHFVVALMFLVFITVQALADRYDHEYFWGVTICAWFWHILGIVWGVVLIVMLIAIVWGDG